MSEKQDVEEQTYPETIAAIDLGSNSFHMIVARVDEYGNFSMIDQLKEMVRMRGGLDSNNNMDPEVEQRALDCLQRFGDRVRHLEKGAVRAAGTNTLRTMKTSRAFLRKGNKALGHKIEIIPGHEEARLVYLGVSHTLSDDKGKQLVIDIGGGSTEFIVGKKFEPQRLESLNIGSVSVTQRFFPDGDLGADKWQSANTALRLEIMPIERAFSSDNWKRATGSSGTIKAARAIVQALELEKFGITLSALYELRDRLISMRNISDIELDGLKDDRAPVFAGGLAVLIAVFESLNIDHMTVSDGALREGLLYDMLGRIQHEDVRDRSVRDLMMRFNIDTAHADAVKKTALHCFEQVRKDWGIQKKRRLTLGWACDLHELGLSITHDKHHLQGGHILEYADIPGFARRRQHWLAVMVKAHRKKLEPELFESLSEDERQTIIYLCILLRLAVLLHRSRLDIELLPSVEGSTDSLHLQCSKELKDHALIEADLQQEKAWLNKIGFKLYF
jgi:exopolyphosphatase/guanosine-5'-triphosphate,3'-diphosphate pyrophosphatase